jgi:hypothetical protein
MPSWPRVWPAWRGLLLVIEDWLGSRVQKAKVAFAVGACMLFQHSVLYHLMQEKVNAFS